MATFNLVVCKQAWKDNVFFFVFFFSGRLVELPDSSGGAAIGSGKTKGWAKLSSSFMA